ncbi:MAG: MBL fold metallo-hydrolase [Myxococcota bacterium]
MDTLFHQDVVVVPLGSGSRGNATYIGDGKHGVLVDCGLSTRQILLRMDSVGLSDAPIDAVLITHEHSDHVAGAAILERKLARLHGESPTFYMTPGTAAGVPERCRPQRVQLIEAGTVFTVGGLRVEPTSVPHDTLDPVCYTVSSGATRAGVITDLGTPTRLLVQQLASLDIAVLEFNHDQEMLMEGDYPWQLKQRIRGHHGHLSNRQAGKLLHEAAKLSRRLQHVMLAHLSDENNTRAKAMAMAELAIEKAGRHDIKLRLAEQDTAIEPARIGKRLVFDTPRPHTPAPVVQRLSRQASLFPDKENVG